MFEELDFSASGEYASAGDLIALDDLIEQDVTVKRWHKNGKPLKLRLKALDLDQQDQINYGALIKHPKTQQWVASEAEFAALSLHHLIIVPRLTIDQARAMRKHNPAIINQIVKYGWSLSYLDESTIEAYASSPDDPPPADDPTGATDE